jgi:hypothetical protein
MAERQQSDLTPGRVVRLRLSQQRSPCFGGYPFGEAGPYEYVVGRVQCEIDPLHPLNRGIVNLDRVPTTPEGKVAYEVDIAFLRPIDSARGNGWLLVEALNRGGTRALHRINDAPATNDPSTLEDAGNGFLMRRGFTIAWVAWQGDGLPGEGRMLAEFPTPVAADGASIVGRCREETIADAPGSVRDALITETSPTTFSVALSYAAASLDSEKASLTVRQRERDSRSQPPGLEWRYLDARRIEITRPPGFDRGAIYEFVYEGRDPIVMGLGFAALRDVVSFLRHAETDVSGAPNPLSGTVRHALLFGLSQSGRMIRDFLYQGFNEAHGGRPAFEAMMPVIAGSRRMFMNEHFAQTSRYQRQHEDHSYPGDQFPFTYATLRDPISGRADGILDRALESGVAPKIMHLDTDSEIWSARASLVVTDTLGHDIKLPDNVRVYLLAGLQHGSYKPPAPGVTQLAANPLDYGPMLRALLSAMVSWIETGAEPPASRFPSRRARTLVTLSEAKARFPSIPGVNFPEVINVLHLTDYSKEPPAEGGEYPVFASATDSDGNGVDGVLHPLIMAPRGSCTGWCLRARGYAEGEFYSIAGSYIPFASTRREREESGDPRLSLEERYGSHEGWVECVRAACEELIAARLLLAEDRDRLLTTAGTSAPPLPTASE